MISEKKLVDQFVRELVCKKMKFTASYISKKIEVDIDFVKKRLLQLSNDDQLIINFDVVCPYKCAHRIIETYSNLKEIHIGKLVKCKCGKEFTIAKENVYVTFSPNKKYYDNEMCKKDKVENMK
jgi:hypothetical protein